MTQSADPKCAWTGVPAPPPQVLGFRGSDTLTRVSCATRVRHRRGQVALSASKLDAVTLEYNQLLTQQLDSQRRYFEGLLDTQAVDFAKVRSRRPLVRAGPD